MEQTTESIQLCASQETVCKAAVNVICKLFSIYDTEGVLLVDALNEFNKLMQQNRLAQFPTIMSISRNYHDQHLPRQCTAVH